MALLKALKQIKEKNFIRDLSATYTFSIYFPITSVTTVYSIDH